MSPLSSENKYKVFEFNTDDDRIEKFAKKVIGKFVNPGKGQRRSSPVDKYKFLQCFAQGTKPQQKTTGSEVVDIGAGVAYGAKFEDVEISNEQIDVDAEVAQGPKVLQKETFETLFDVDNSSMSNQCSYSVSYTMDMPREDGSSREVAGSNYFNYGNEQVGVILDDDDSIEMSSPTTSSSSFSDKGGTSAISVSSEEWVAERGFCEHEIDNENKMVVVIPDYIIYGGNFCKESRISFSCSSVKVEGSTVNENKEIFSFEWTIGDIINIQSGWFGNIETVVVHISHTSKYSTRDRIANEISGAGIELLMFAVCDLHWPERQEAIKSLDVRYKDKWNAFFDPDTKYEENAFLSQKSKLPSKKYSFEFDEPFEEVIYPKGDPDAVLIIKRDVELLSPGTFINDTIIDFYIKYLKNKIQPEEQHRFHFFNSFFFRKLADLDKDPSSASEGRAAFQRIRKWTRKVNLFEKDYIFIPVNYSLHWSLIVICYPGEVAYFKDDEIEKSLKVPCILHMDSIKGSHRGLKNLIQSYLCEEWKERHGTRDAEVPSKFLHLRFVPLELPQQENSFDCGLFLLHYVELFLEEVPSNFNPFKLTQFSNFLNWNWFPPAEASMKRAQIKKLIYEICEDSSHKEDLSADCIDVHPSPQSITDENGKGTRVFLGKSRSPTVTGQQRFPSISDAKKGIEISSSRASPQRGAHCPRDPFIFSKQCQPGTSPISVFDRRYQLVTACYQKGIMSPIEEAEENGEPMDNSPCNVEHFQQFTKLATESPTTSYVSRDCRVRQKKYCDKRFSRHFGVLDESMKECHSSSEEKLDKDQPIAEYEVSNYPETTDIPEEEDVGIAAVVVEDSEEEDGGIAAVVVEDSQEEDGGIAAIVVDSEEENCMQDSKGNKGPSNQKYPETICLDENIMPIGNEFPVSKADEQVVKKVRRLLPEYRNTERRNQKSAKSVASLKGIVK